MAESTNFFLLTGAADWPMMVTTLKLVFGIVGILFSMILGLVSAFWLDFRKQFTKHETDAEKKCTVCHAAIEDDFDNVWKAVDHCCPRTSNQFRKESKRTCEGEI